MGQKSEVLDLPAAVVGSHVHCGHVMGPEFQITLRGQSAPTASGQAANCCHCGAVRVVYEGVPEEPGHGPWVVFKPGAPRPIRQPDPWRPPVGHC